MPTPGYTLSVPAVAFDAQGGAITVWSEVDFTPPSPYLRRLQGATRMPGVGEPWSAAALIADPARSDYSFSFAHDVLGTVAAAWVGSGTAGPEVHAAVRPPGGPFSPAAVVGLGANRSVAVDAGGNALVGSRGAGSEARVAVYDATPPVIAAVSVPAALTTGQPGAFGATVVDAWAGLATGSPTWSFGDGTAAPGPAAAHAYGGAGSFPVTLGAVDAVGNAASVAAGTVAVTDPPVDPASLPSVTLGGVRVSSRYRQSRLTGAVTTTGRTNLPATLDVRVVTSGPRARVLARLRRAVPAGPFSLRLALPATLVPGRYVVRIQGTSAGVALPAVQRSFTIPAPPEGVVSRAYAHAAPNGPAALRLRGVRQAVYATFVFASLPRRGPITISWVPPAGAKETAGADKPRERRITGGAIVRGAGARLTPGRWRARLRVHGVLVAETAVRIG